MDVKSDVFVWHFSGLCSDHCKGWCVCGSIALPQLIRTPNWRRRQADQSRVQRRIRRNFSQYGCWQRVTYELKWIHVNAKAIAICQTFGGWKFVNSSTIKSTIALHIFSLFICLCRYSHYMGNGPYEAISLPGPTLTIARCKPSDSLVVVLHERWLEQIGFMQYTTNPTQINKMKIRVWIVYAWICL